MHYNYEDDISYAKDVCREYPPAVKKIHHEYSEKVLFISNKFVNSKKKEDGWSYTSSKGFRIKVNDDVSDTYLWLIGLIISKCCSFTGKNKAKLSTYINSLINSSYTFNDWLKKKYRNSNYVPKAIKELPEIYSEIFLLLSRGNSYEQIKTKVNIDDLDHKINKIRNTLIEIGQLHIIERFVVQLGVDKDIRELPFKEKIKDQNDLEMTVENILKPLLSDLDTFERRLLLMYWGTEMSTKQIFLFINSEDNVREFTRLSIKKEKDIYQVVTKIIKSLYSLFSTRYPEFKMKYNINELKFKKITKIYIRDIYVKN